MRFHADGPSIPDELLEASDGGRVVFFCGAGVSRAAGLPDFLRLTERVIERLGVPASAESNKLWTQNREGGPLDRVFYWLQQEYGVAEVELAVLQELAAEQTADVEKHSTILRLSRNATGSPCVVTTNFDRIFERAHSAVQQGTSIYATELARQSTLTVHVGPRLPELNYERSFDGVVYLHGRLSDSPRPGVNQGLVLSTADFGRAYLAEGWAAEFARSLHERKVIVLLGYSATDPPVAYLLEGLRLVESSQSPTIYAFVAEGKPEESGRWQRLGVQPLTYRSSKDRTSLWNTLKSWSERATDLPQWQSAVCALASRAPRDLEPHQRGQVLSLLRTAAGARQFSQARPRPSAQWLCVFDRSVRRAKPLERYDGHPSIDPREWYGLDAELLDTAPELVSATSDDILAVLTADEWSDRSARLALNNVDGGYLPDRLMHLISWISAVRHEPATVWWAAGYDKLQPKLLDRIEFHQSRENADAKDPFFRAWALIIGARQRAHPSMNSVASQQLEAQIRRYGWTAEAVDEFSRLVRPTARITRPKFTWPSDAATDLSLSALVTADVMFPKVFVEGPFRSVRCMAEVVGAFRRGLVHGAVLLDQADQHHFFHTATLVPDTGPGEPHRTDADEYVVSFVKVFDRLAREAPEAARTEVASWPESDVFFFDKLRIYALMNQSLYSAAEAAEGLLALSDEALWSDNHRRELLHTLKARWSELDTVIRDRLEDRILTGPPELDSEDSTELHRYATASSVMVLGWLRANRCHLSPRATRRLYDLRALLSNWNRRWEIQADDSRDSRGGTITFVTDPSGLLDVSIQDLAAAAAERTVRDNKNLTDYEPFIGLVASSPPRAVAALLWGVKKGQFAEDLWQTSLAHWPGNATKETTWILARALVLLPAVEFMALRNHAAQWLARNIAALFQASPSAALRIWDSISEYFIAASLREPEATLAVTATRGRARSRRTVDHAAISPVGVLTESLFSVFQAPGLTASAGLPMGLRARVERLLECAGEPADHVTSVVAQHIGWLFWIDPAWVESTLVPWFDPNAVRCEPAWSGYLRPRDQGARRAPLVKLLKPHLLNVFQVAANWQWDQGPMEALATLLVQAVRVRLDSGELLVGYHEARDALRCAGSAGRVAAVEVLSQAMKTAGAWESFLEPFIRDAWPREFACRCDPVSRAFASMAWKSGDEFPMVAETIAGLVQRVDHLYLSHGEAGVEPTLASRFPEAALSLLDRLVSDNRRAAPPGLLLIVTAIGSAAPSLRRDERWRRLSQICG